MALNTAQKDKKQHRHRKNPRSHELYKAENHAQNEKRPKQRWVGGNSVAEGGYWTREAV
jgi:hypothetical protein